MNFFQRFFYGRYGIDQLGKATLCAYLLFYLLSLVTNHSLFLLLSTLLAFLTLYRMLSRNIQKRHSENQWFLKKTAPLWRWYRTRKMIHSDKDHRYFKCPACGQRLRVPKGNGKIKITCRSCGNQFEANS